MYKDRSVGVVVPAYNEEQLIGAMLAALPAYIDRIIVVNDGSRDRTAEIVRRRQLEDERIVLVEHQVNQGLGQSIIDGYLKSRELDLDITAIMDGDGQMSPADLPRVLDPVARGVADFCKGNRLLHRELSRMPLYRLYGNAVLTFLTKFATGYWQLMDPQCAFSAISKRALSKIPIEQMTRRYGYNADLLNLLNIYNFRVAMVEVEPVYGAAVSVIRLRTYVPRLSALLVRLFFRRLIRKYLVRNFNPLCLSYICGLGLLVCGSLPFGLRVLYVYLVLGQEFPQTSFLCFMFLTIAGLQVLLSAIQYDMEDNRQFLTIVEREEEFELRHASASLADALPPGGGGVPANTIEPATARRDHIRV